MVLLQGAYSKLPSARGKVKNKAKIMPGAAGGIALSPRALAGFAAASLERKASRSSFANTAEHSVSEHPARGCQILIRNTGLGWNGSESPASPADPASTTLCVYVFPRENREFCMGSPLCVCPSDGWENTEKRKRRNS